MARLPRVVGARYATKNGSERGVLRMVLTDDLVAITGDPWATMRWSAASFRRLVFLKYSLKLVGWPPDIPFCDLSKSGPSAAQIRELVGLWEEGELYFDDATPAEMAAARTSLACAVPGPLFPTPAPTIARCDIGKRRKPYRYERNGPKSAKWVE